MLWLALPVLAEELLNMLVGYADWWLTGHFLEGTQYQAAMALMAYILWLLPSLFAAVAIGATAMTSRFVGAGDAKAANRVTNQAVIAGIALAVVATVCAFFLGSTFVTMLQLEGEAAALATRYLMILVPVMPAIMIEQVGIACLRGAGDTVSGLVVKTIVNIINVALSFALVIGLGPFPELGWVGLAIGTACGHGMGGLIVLGLLLFGRAGLRLETRLLRPDRDLIRRLMRIGLPGGADVLAVLSCHLWYAAIINSLGTLQAAAHGLGVMIESMAYLPGSAFSVAAATMAGQYLGAGDSPKAVHSVLTACLVGMAVMSAAGLVFYFGADQLTGFFLRDDQRETAERTAALLRVVAFSMPSLALVMILTGALRGAGDTRWPLLFTFIGLLGIRIPGAYLLAWDEIQLPLVDVTIQCFNLSVIGAWYAMVVDTVVRSVLVVYRFWHGGWKGLRV